MRSPGTWMAAVLLLAASASGEETQHATTAAHAVVKADAIAWGPAPPGLPPGSKAAVLSGNPGAPGPFTLRAWLPAGYRILPHWHDTYENLTVISGAIHVGEGETFDEKKALPMSAGDYVPMAPKMLHWLWAEGETILQVNGEGPFTITYVRAEDDPRRQPTPSK